MYHGRVTAERVVSGVLVRNIEVLQQPVIARSLRAHDFDSFSSFLQHKLSQRKARASHLTLRQFARSCGLKSPAAVSMMLHGKRLPSLETLDDICRVLKLSESEITYIRYLVAYERAESEQEKKLFLEKMADHRAQDSFERAVQESFAKWYFAALLELVRYSDFREDPEWIAKQLRDKVTQQEIVDALRALEGHGALTRTHDGKLVPTSTDREIPSGPNNLNIRRYHQEMIHLALESTTLDATERYLTGLTIALEESEYQEVTSEITRFVRSLLVKYTSKKVSLPVERIFQLNVQFFPLTSKRN